MKFTFRCLKVPIFFGLFPSTGICLTDKCERSPLLKDAPGVLQHLPVTKLRLTLEGNDAHEWNKSLLSLSPQTFTVLACDCLYGTMEQHYQRLILVILSPLGSPSSSGGVCRSAVL